VHSFAVEFGDVGGGRGVVEVDGAGQLVDAVGGGQVLHHARPAVGPHAGVVALCAVGPQVDVPSGVVRREGGAAEAFGQGQQVPLGRADPLAAVVDHDSAVALLGADPAADAIGAL